MRAALWVALAALAAPAVAQITLTEVSCATNGRFRDGPPPPTVPNGHIAWPAEAPVWEFDLYRAGNRTTLNGSGLELRDVRFRGRKVLERAGVPVLNVEYDPGVGCSCFRDWQHDEAPQEIGDDAVQAVSCYAEAQPGDVVTACEANASDDPDDPDAGGDVGEFYGVSVEDYGTELVLTAHAQAGWYRYRMRWHFYTDGRIWPEFSFAATEAICTQGNHRHHAYWRFDFDIDGTPRNDVLTETIGDATETLRTESSRVLPATADAVAWTVTDAATGDGYRIVPSAADRRVPVDPFSKTDALALRYKLAELDDGLTIETGCAFAFEPFVDGESLEGEDLVFWYRSSALHEGGDPFSCDIVGPMLHPVGFVGLPLPGPTGVEIFTPSPNPFAERTRLTVRVAETQPLTVDLLDAVGRRVRVLYNGRAEADRSISLDVDGRGLPAGTYIVRVRGPLARGTAQIVRAR